MNSKGYTVLGWLVWQLTSRLAKFWIRQNKAKVGAAGAVMLVLIGGLVAAKAGSDED